MKSKRKENTPPVPRLVSRLEGFVNSRSWRVASLARCDISSLRGPLCRWRVCVPFRARSLSCYDRVLAAFQARSTVYRGWCPLPKKRAYPRDLVEPVAPGAQSHCGFLRKPRGLRSSPGGPAWEQSANALPIGARQSAYPVERLSNMRLLRCAWGRRHVHKSIVS